MFKEDVNPYVKEIESHQDVVHKLEKGELLSLNTLFNESKAVILDLGCGSGNFLRDYALKYENYNFIGFEVRYKRLVKGAIKFKKKGIENIKLVQGRAEEIGECFGPHTIREININFPDPWTKKKHRKHRLIQPEYLRTLHRILEPGGHFVFKTDHREYFYSVCELLSNQESLQIVEKSEDLHRSPYNERNILTEFEALFQAKSYPIFYLRTIAT